MYAWIIVLGLANLLIAEHITLAIENENGNFSIGEGLDSLGGNLKFLGYDIDRMVNWTELDTAVEDLNPSEFAELYSPETIRLVVQFREQLRRAKNLYHNSTGRVFSWSVFAEPTLDDLKSEFERSGPVITDEEKKKLIQAFKSLLENGSDNFQAVYSALKEIQDIMGKARDVFEDFKSSTKADHAKLLERQNSMSNTLKVVVPIVGVVLTLLIGAMCFAVGGPIAAAACTIGVAPAVLGVWYWEKHSNAENLERINKMYGLLSTRIQAVNTYMEKVMKNLEKEQSRTNRVRKVLKSEVDLFKILKDDLEQRDFLLKKIDILNSACAEYINKHKKDSGLNGGASRRKRFNSLNATTTEGLTVQPHPNYVVNDKKLHLSAIFSAPTRYD